MNDEPVPEIAAAVETEPVVFSTPAPAKPAPALAAKWLPIGGMKAPKILDGTMAGDAGFDPLGFSKSQKTLLWMREAEIKHGRLAMLAAVGWPVSELLHKEIASTFHLQSILAGGGRAPSLLNGGLNSVYAFGVLTGAIAAAGFLEGKAMQEGSIFWGRDKAPGYKPGDFGFDPLNLNSKAMETREIKNGRLAMIAITVYAFSEASSGKPVTELTPFLF